MNDTYHCTAGDLATCDPESLAQDTTVGDAVQWFDEKGYDFAPVIDDGEPIGYASREELIDAPEDTLLGDHCNSITIDEILDSETRFPEVLDALYSSEFYFLGGRNRIAAIISRADINREPTYMHLYAELSRLERLFRRLIQNEAPDWKEQVRIHPDIVEDIETRRERAQEANIDFDEIFYAQFSTQAKIICSVESCWRSCGFSSPEQAGSALNDVVTLRNDVAHSRPVLQNTNQGLLEEGRTITKLEDTYLIIQNCIEELTPSRRPDSEEM